MTASSFNSLDDFLTRFLSKKQPSYASIFTSPPENGTPTWATPCTNLLYAPKSIPKVFAEPNRLYITFEKTTPHRIGLIGETHHKKINRTLDVEAKGSSVIVRSKHKNMKTNDYITFEGRGNNFETAINDYFKKSDLKDPEYKFAIENIQKEGDAFLLQQTIHQKGYSFVINQVIESVKKLFDLIEKDKHETMMAAIHRNMKNVTPELEKISHHYDAKLWVIVETICKFFDPLQQVDKHPQRKGHRDQLIAECCNNLMKGKDVIPGFKNYLEALDAHNHILKEYERGDLHESIKNILSQYQQEDFSPEVLSHREKIKNCYDEYCQVKEEKLNPKPGG